MQYACTFPISGVHDSITFIAAYVLDYDDLAHHSCRSSKCSGAITRSLVAETMTLNCRQVLNLMVFFGFMFNYMLRVNLTIAIVEMVAKDNLSLFADLGANQTVRTPRHQHARSNFYWLPTYHMWKSTYSQQNSHLQIGKKTFPSTTRRFMEPVE